MIVLVIGRLAAREFRHVEDISGSPSSRLLQARLSDPSLSPLLDPHSRERATSPTPEAESDSGTAWMRWKRRRAPPPR